MIIGVPKEIKDHEYRVALTPESVRELVSPSTRVIIETTAGVGSGYSDDQYIASGAEIVESADVVFSQSDLIIKVKEPQASERARLRKECVLFTYLHLAPDIEQTQELLDCGATCLAYETVTSDNGTLPLLTPMSEIAGRIAAQVGAHFLEKTHGGSGILMSGVPGVEAANVIVIGGGVVGKSAARVAYGMGANVTILDRSTDVLRAIESEFSSHINTLFSTQEAIRDAVKTADVIIGAVLVPGAEAPKLIKKADLSLMKQGSVLVDVAVDQGGCFETTQPTTHSNPVFIEQGIVHYCVANMPGAYARTASMALNNATLPYIREICSKGVKQALKENAHLANGLNIVSGKLTNQHVADAQNREFITINEAITHLD